jgi:aryl-alcohol dehydrogenase-like predicted oxidoreductase
LLTGKYLPENVSQSKADGARMHSEMMKGFGAVDEGTHVIVREIVAVGKELGVSAAQVALAWLRYRPVPVIPIIGARKLAQVEDNLRSLDVALSPEQLQRLDKASAVSLGFPHDFMALEPVKAIVFGGLRDRIKA